MVAHKDYGKQSLDTVIIAWSLLLIKKYSAIPVVQWNYLATEGSQERQLTKVSIKSTAMSLCT